MNSIADKVVEKLTNVSLNSEAGDDETYQPQVNFAAKFLEVSHVISAEVIEISFQCEAGEYQEGDFGEEIEMLLRSNFSVDIVKALTIWFEIAPLPAFAKLVMINLRPTRARESNSTSSAMIFKLDLTSAPTCYCFPTKICVLPVTVLTPFFKGRCSKERNRPMQGTFHRIARHHYAK